MHDAFADSLDDLTVEQLDLPVDMTRAGLGIWLGRDLYELHGCVHPYIHGGEIAVLKGLQGGLGWAESEAFRAAVSKEDFGEWKSVPPSGRNRHGPGERRHPPSVLDL